MVKQSPLLYGAYKALGAKVVEVEPFFGSIACMRNAEREQYANLEIAKILFRDKPKLISICSLLQRVLQLRGMALWPRTELTDLSAKAQTNPLKLGADMRDYLPSELDIDADIYADAEEANLP